MTVPPLTLISHPLCPYVQRAAIALAEKNIAFDRRMVDLKAKPDWFLAVSPRGKVPLLLVRGEDGGETALFESAAICEYIEETQPGRRLHPADTLARARHRGWIEFGSAILSDLWGFETARDGASFRATQAALVAKFSRVEAELASGPFFAGEAFSLVDAVFAPIFRYFEVFDRLGPARVLDGLPKVTAWARALAARPSVRDAVGPDYATLLLAFLADNDAWLLRQDG
ncbi:glutathione S-transferase family protein [Methylobacterium sp. JK268]